MIGPDISPYYRRSFQFDATIFQKATGNAILIDFSYFSRSLACPLLDDAPLLTGHFS